MKDLKVFLFLLISFISLISQQIPFAGRFYKEDGRIIVSYFEGSLQDRSKSIDTYLRLKEASDAWKVYLLTCGYTIEVYKDIIGADIYVRYTPMAGEAGFPGALSQRQMDGEDPCGVPIIESADISLDRAMAERGLCSNEPWFIFTDGPISRPSGCPNTGFYLYSIIAHEVGHVLGLKHAGNSGSIMYSQIHAWEWKDITESDGRALRKLYSTDDPPQVKWHKPSDGKTIKDKNPPTIKICFDRPMDVPSVVSSVYISGWEYTYDRVSGDTLFYFKPSSNDKDFGNFSLNYLKINKGEV